MMWSWQVIKQCLLIVMCLNDVQGMSMSPQDLHCCYWVVMLVCWQHLKHYLASTQFVISHCLVIRMHIILCVVHDLL